MLTTKLLLIMNRLHTALLLILMALTSVASAASDTDELRDAIARKMPGVEITRITKSPLPGLYQVISGSQVVYMTRDARFMLDGNFVNLESKRNYTEEAKSGVRLDKINSLGEDKMLIYTPQEVKHTVTIVTDINCPYCRRLHDEMDDYLKLGVQVRYIFMPLKGRDDFEKTVSVWCSKDRNLSLDIVKAGGTIDSKNCDNPIQQHLSLSRKIGIRGTPAIILEDGSLLPGYVPIEKLITELRKI